MHKIKKVLVIGSGPIVIGQGAEFDYAGTEACLALKEEGIEVILLNNNPATIMTDESIADHIYMEPMTVTTIEEIFQKEQPDGMIGTLGGQTGLNLTLEVYQSGLLEKYDVQLLGTSVDSIQQGEDREKFRALMQEMGEPVADSHIITTVDQAIHHAEEMGYPVMVRPAYTLGGAGGGFAEDAASLQSIVTTGLQVSPIHQVLLEKSIKGWKEIELEVIRDRDDDCVIVCSMENVDPVGVHTGDSIVVAPQQTLTEEQYSLLRDAAVKIICRLGVVGACNIQFAFNQDKNSYYIIEVNPRVSRSSALASKATGCPIAVIATKCALGFKLDDCFPSKTEAVHELMIDYTVVKMPRFSFDKFPTADRKLGTQMKATGETMAIDLTFEAALNKAIRSLDNGLTTLTHPMISGQTDTVLLEHMQIPTDLRLFAIAEALRQGKSIQEVYHYTSISLPFLEKIKQIVEMEVALSQNSLATISAEQLRQAKQMQISDKALSELLQTTESAVREKIKACHLSPTYQVVDSENHFPYYYSTWHDDLNHDARCNGDKKVLIIGSGPILIGQGMEFDYGSVQAIYALKKMGYTTVIVNNNPETVSTDSTVADRLYFEALTAEDILAIVNREKVAGVLIQFGGQTAINLAKELKAAGVRLYGTTPEKIDQLEDRQHFYQLLKQLHIPHMKGEMAYSLEEIKAAANRIGYPVIVRPSYVIGGQSMYILHQEETMDAYLATLRYSDQRIWPILIDNYTPGLEVELDAISDGEHILVPGIVEHVERAGVHSGDSIAVMPPVHLSKLQQNILLDYTKSICKQANIVGLVNIQFVVTDEQIYVLEVNPRASRTVPMISKITGVPMVEHAVRTQMGEKLKADGGPESLGYYAVKAPVFSAAQLTGVDPKLGPEMKSTGELIGLANTYQQALAKATYFPAYSLNKDAKKPYLLCSIADREKAAFLPVLKTLSQDFSLLATSGTSAFLTAHGVANQTVDSNPEALSDLFQEQSLAGVVVIPSGFQDKRSGNEIRTLAITHQVALFTCLETLQVAVDCMDKTLDPITSLQSYHRLYATI
ncbi:carbamoyl-phosphate synthase (glutamine-hydrolyzing) large subunit [Lentibacillus sp. Marseille-P4043]|uniref:carbamoyl-phosphate synthase (glutamine-hydrolyzing) large subunit n=1 Tax=Lentibacillus sp. Marseille-P4043 TaxID=2040293 RepID=UPI000D0AC4F3